MRLRNSLFCLILTLSPFAHSSESLKAYCNLNDGQLIDQWTCPSSNEVRKESFCVLKNEQNQELVFNGCTGIKGSYGDLFFKACTLHDFCYHHEPSTSGKSKQQCDNKFLKDTLATCEELSDGKKRCKAMAYSFYLAVRAAGSKSWNCSKLPAQYPTLIEEL